jgi:hypothetical protein
MQPFGYGTHVGQGAGFLLVGLFAKTSCVPIKSPRIKITLMILINFSG